MTLVATHGGGASKVSDIYEDIWTLYAMLDLLAGRATAIKLEPPGPPGTASSSFSGVLTGMSGTQVKFQNSNGKWTLFELKNEQVLRRFKNKLEGDPTASCRFISSHSTYPLSKLCAHACKAKSLETFKETCLSSEDLRDAFKALRDDHWELPEPTVWDWLRGRVLVSLVDDEFLEQTLEERLATYVTGTPNDALVALDEIKQATLYDQLDAAELKQQLTDKGCPPRPLEQAKGSVRDLVRSASQSLAEGLGSLLIQNTFLARNAVAENEVSAW